MNLRTRLVLGLSAVVVGLGGVCAAAAQPSASISAPASAAAPRAAAGPAWSRLNAQQHTALAPLERDWASIDPQRKAKWLEVAARFPSLPAADQQRVQERMAEWARMTPAERGRARLSFQESKQFSPEHKQARWEAYQALPDEQRKALAGRGKPADDGPRPAALAAAANPAAGPLKPVATAKPAASASVAKPVSPTVVQAKPGATTTLMTKAVEPPAHHRPGQPKIVTDPAQVNRSTLLPQSGPQAAASAAHLP